LTADDNSSKHKAFYYPYLFFQDAGSLYKSILFFDKIYLVNPWQVGVAPRKSDGKIDYEALRKEESPFKKLEEKKLIQYLPESNLVEEHGENLSKAVGSDLTDKGFKELCSAKGKDSSYIPMRSYTGYHFKGKGFVDNIPQEYRESFDNLGKGFTSFPFIVAESIMINYAILAAANFDATPFTTSSLHDEFLSYKLRRPVKDEGVKELLKEYDYIKDTKIDLTAYTVINKKIPVLENVTLDRLLEFRDDHRKSLERFRTEMGKLASNIKSNYWDEDFKREIRDQIDREINPALQALEDSTKSFVDNLRSAAAIGATAAATAFVAAVHPGMVIGAAAIGAAATGAGNLLKDFLDKRRSSDQTKKKNGLSYILDLKKLS
jgi:hypothetical protein